MDILRLAVQDKYEGEDLALLTKMEVTIPVRSQDLKHHIKNLAGLAGRCLGQDCILHRNLKELAEHVEDQETAYNYEFRQERLFGGHVLDKSHWGINKFLDSCANGNPDHIQTRRIDWTGLMDQIESREFVTKIPSWIRKLVKKREGKPQEAPNGRGAGGGGREDLSGQKRRQFNQQEGRRAKIFNSNIMDECKLKKNELLRTFFTPQTQVVWKNPN